MPATDPSAVNPIAVNPITSRPRLVMPRPIRLALAALLVAAGAPPAHAADDRAVTDALMWVGASERVARRTLDRRDRPAIRTVERRLGGYADGRLDGGERRALIAAARHAREREGYRTLTDPATGARIGLPTAWLGPRREAEGGSAWVSPDGAIAVETFRARGLDAFERAERARPGVAVTYAAGRGSWRVVSGREPGGRTFYARAGVRNGQVTAFRVTYETGLGERLDRVAVAMSSDFRPGVGFGAGEGAGSRAGAATSGALAYAPLPDGGRLRDGGRFEPLVPRYAVLPDAGPSPRERPIASLAPKRTTGREVGRETVPPRIVDAPAPLRPRRSDPLSLDDADAGNADAGLSLDPVRDLDPASEGGTPDTGETERAVPSTITGFVTDEGQSCPTLRGPDGTLYALVGEVPALLPGTLVTIEAVGVDTTRCSAGRTVAVGGLSVEASPR